MSRVISFFNNKGGSAKTTSTFNIASGLKLKGKSVLCIDLDPQANLSLSFLGLEEINKHRDYNINHVFKEEKDAIQVIVKLDNGIDLIPSDLNLTFTENTLFNHPVRSLILKNSIVGIKDLYDYVLIDNSPSFSILAENSFAAADEVMIPAGADEYSIWGAGLLISYIEQYVKAKINRKIDISGAFITNCKQRTKYAQDMIEHYKEIFGDKLFKTIISESTKLKECYSYNQSIFEYRPKDKAAIEYGALVDEIIAQEQYKEMQWR